MNKLLQRPKKENNVNYKLKVNFFFKIKDCNILLLAFFLFYNFTKALKNKKFML